MSNFMNRLLLVVALAGVFGILGSFSVASRLIPRFFPVAIASTLEVEPEQLCVVQDRELNEASGIAISRQYENAVWIHNDSGDSARLFLVGFDGKTKATLSVNGATPMDWEDMCSFELDGEKWLLIGDTGDNARARGKGNPPCILLLVREPKVEAVAETTDRVPVMKVDVFASVEFSFPEGPADCESVAVDTKRKEILLLTKTDPFNCRLYRLPLTLNPGRSKAKAEMIAAVAVPYATAMDVSPDGSKLAIVNMFSGALMIRQDSETWKEACEKPAVVLTLPARPQGETVCFDADAKALLVNSEGVAQPLWRISLSTDPEAD